MVILCRVKFFRRFDCRHNRLRINLRGRHLGDHILRNPLLLFFGLENYRPILLASVIALAIERRGIMHGEENIQQFAIVD